MLTDTAKLDRSDGIFTELQQIYKSYGYKRFMFGRFEEYSLYSENKSFLVCENVLTFSANDGRLLALKPDVTLSIVKNTNASPENTEKLFYRENVYRFDKKSGEYGEYREINQVGVEVIGNVDGVATYELISLAVATFGVIGGEFLLDISHIGYIAGLLEACGINEGTLRAELLASITAKNTHDLGKIADGMGIPKDMTERLKQVALLGRNGESCDEILKKARIIAVNEKMNAALDELEALFSLFDNKTMSHIKLDFSMLNDMDYYNGIILRGYLKNVPKAVLTGGRYDKLLLKYGRKNTGAMGFALYLSELAPYFKNVGNLADILLLYDGDNTDSIKAAITEAEALRAEGYSVRTEKTAPVGCSFGRTVNAGKSRTTENGGESKKENRL